MTEARNRRAVPDWQLERFRLQELPAREMAALTSALADDDELRRRLDRLAMDDRATLEALAPSAMAAAVRSRVAALPQRPGRARPLWLPALATAAALVVAVGIALRAPEHRPAGTDRPQLQPTRIKGLRPEILLFRKTSSGAEPLMRTSVAHTGDVIQLAYQAAGRRYGVIVSVDSRGIITPHLPRQGRRSPELTPGANVPLPDAYELDDAPRWETFYLVLSARPFDVGVVVAAVRAAAPTPPSGDGGAPVRLVLPPGFEQSSFLLRKDLAR